MDKLVLINKGIKGNNCKKGSNNSQRLINKKLIGILGKKSIDLIMKGKKVDIRRTKV